MIIHGCGELGWGGGFFWPLKKGWGIKSSRDSQSGCEPPPFSYGADNSRLTPLSSTEILARFNYPFFFCRSNEFVKTVHRAAALKTKIIKKKKNFVTLCTEPVLGQVIVETKKKNTNIA